ncbi:MAG: flavoprotein, partial [Veillonella sp.]|nr:flavoprotein [Veillonella sp.]
MRGKHIIVAVSAGIAAYKAIEVVSRLRKKGAEVKVVMTQNSTHIASPLTFGEISGHPVAIDMFEQVHQWDVEHIALATWADAYVVVPATANVIGKIYAGIADDMLTTTIMATKAPKYLCPAMNTEMYNNPITQRNLEGLRS